MATSSKRKNCTAGSEKAMLEVDDFQVDDFRVAALEKLEP